MTEDQATKKPGSAKRFLKRFFLCVKWLFVFILAFLLIAGIYFQAPLKILILLAIFLIALTILPKPFRKYFWLTFTCFVIALAVWVFLPEETSGDWKPYTFEEDIKALNEEYAIQDEDNASVIYKQLLHVYDANAFYPEFLDDDLNELTVSEPWSSRDYPQVAEWLKDHEKLFLTLAKASEKDNCLFEIGIDPLSIHHKAEMSRAIKIWARLLIRAANNDLGDGRIEASLQKSLIVLKIVEHLYQQPDLITILTGIGIESFAIHNLSNLIISYPYSDNYTAIIEKTMKNLTHPRSKHWPLALEHDRFMVLEKVSDFYEINPKGETRLSRNPAAEITKIISNDPFFKEYHIQVYWLKKALKVLTIVRWACLPATPEKALEIVNNVHRKISSSEPYFIWGKGPADIQGLTFKFNYPYMLELRWRRGIRYFDKIHDLYLRKVSHRIGTQLMIHLRRYKNKHGTWPKSLDEIKNTSPDELFVDPINNGSYVYKLTEDDFKLYSKGENNIDEDGERGTKKADETKTDDILFWPKRDKKSKTTKEEAGDGG